MKSWNRRCEGPARLSWFFWSQHDELTAEQKWLFKPLDLKEELSQLLKVYFTAVVLRMHLIIAQFG